MERRNSSILCFSRVSLLILWIPLQKKRFLAEHDVARIAGRT